VICSSFLGIKEAKPPVMARHLFFECVHQQRASSDMLCCSKHALHGILEQVAADPATLLPSVHSKPGQDHRWDRIGGIAPEVGRAVLVGDRGGRKGVVAGNIFCPTDHKRVRCTLRERWQGSLREPDISTSSPQSKLVRMWPARSGAGSLNFAGPAFRRMDYFPHGGVLAIKATNSAVGTGGASSAA
jgi:hypothetical protein